MDENIILDSNLWIAYFNENDSMHKSATEIFKKQKKIIIPEYIILETATILLLKANRKIAKMFIEIIFDNNDIEIIPSNNIFLFKTKNQFLENKTGKLSFVDCGLVELSKNYKIITFDKELQKSIDKKKNNKLRNS